MKLRPLLIIILLLALSACSSPVQETQIIPTPFDGGVIQPPAAAISAQSALAAELGVASDQILIRDIQSAQWSNTCLDAATVDEFCAQQVTAGYLVVLEYGESTDTYHTDLEGIQVRRVQQVADPSAAALQSRQLLAGLLGYDPEAVRIVSEESVLFADSCLEITIPETVCPQVQIRGKKITLEANNNFFEFHSADEPIEPILAVAAGVLAGRPVIMLSRKGGPDNTCDNLNITLSGKVIQYSCRGVPGEVPGIFELTSENQAHLLRWVLKYSPYDVTQTRQDGTTLRVTFYGTGPDEAQFEAQETIRLFSEGLIRAPRPFPTPMPTVGPEE
ncbi:MAG: hypothetical protein ACYDGL_11180 [Bellilinea sp.]